MLEQSGGIEVGYEEILLEQHLQTHQLFKNERANEKVYL